MKKWRNLAVAISSTILIVTGSIYTWSVVDSYNRMQVLKIETFDSLWKDKFFIEKSKTISRASDKELSVLKSLAKTPSEKKKYRFVEISIKLMRLEDKKSSMTIDEILQTISDYKSNQDNDKDFAAQKEINQKILANSEKFVQDLTNSIQSLSILDDKNVLSYDSNIREETKFSIIDSSIRWEHLARYNDSIRSLNLEIEKQVKENKQTDRQNQIIELKSRFEKFLALIESTKESLKNDYVSVKEFKKIVKALDKIDLSKSDWLSDVSVFNEQFNDTQIVTSLSDKFFEDNSELSNLKDLAKNMKIIVKVRVNVRSTRNRSEETKSQTMTISHTDISSLSEDSLLKKSTISNFRVNIKLDQSKIIYVESETRTSSSDKINSSSSSSSSSSSTSGSSESYESSETYRDLNEGE